MKRCQGGGGASKVWAFKSRDRVCLAVISLTQFLARVRGGEAFRTITHAQEGYQKTPN
jgi:hypothetical protein